jgi:uncharacterized membrane protein YgcG
MGIADMFILRSPAVGLRCLAAGLVFSLSLLAFEAARAETVEIGNVEEIRLALYGTVVGGDSERLYENDHVYANELIETVKKSGAQIRFLDDTDLWLGASSQLTLDSFIYDPDQGSGEMVAELSVGLFRFVTGNLPGPSYEIRTPAAVIGIRGTDFSVAVAADGATEVSVYSGQVSVSPRGGGAAAAVNPGETAAVATATGSVSVSPSSQSAPPASVSAGQGSAASGSSGGGNGGGGGSGGGGSSCFTPETRIVMADGELKAIRDIVIGDVVLGQDGAHNLVTGIEQVRLAGRMLYGFDGGPPFVTAEHPFMTESGWKSIDPSATAAENGSLEVARLAPGDSLVTMRRSAWRLAALGDPLGLGEGALGHQRLASLAASAADPATALYNLLLDGNHSYWVVHPGAAALMQTISAAPKSEGEAGNAYLVHNKGG